MMIFTLLKKPVLYIPLILVVFGVALSLGRGDGSAATTFIATRGDFIQQVSVSGRVVSRESVDLVFSQAGRVAVAYAAVGDIVGAGTVLASVENEDARAEIVQKEAALAAAEARLRALRAGIRPSLRAVTLSLLASVEVAETQARRALVDALQSAYTNVDDAIRRRVDQFMENPTSAHPALAFLVPDAQLQSAIEWERFLLEELLTGWKESLASLSAEGDNAKAGEDAAANLLRVGVFLEKVAEALNALSASPNLSQTTLASYRADIAAARMGTDAATASLTAAITAEKSAVAAHATAEKQLADADAPAREEDLAVEEAQVRIAEADLARALERYQKTLIRAPFAGVITRMDAKVGGSASANEAPIAMMSADMLQIESFIPEINVPLIAAGDTAIALLDAYGQAAPFAATVISVDPGETIRDGVSTYRAKLVFAAPDARIKSGMTASITIETERKKDVIAVPQGALVLRDGAHYVTVKEGAETMVLREVVTGALSASGTIEILSGLREGEVVMLPAAEEKK